MIKKLSGLAVDSSVYGIGSFLAQFISFFLLPLYTRMLTPYDYGVLAMLGIMSSMVKPLCFLGVNSSVFRFFGKYKEPHLRVQLLSTAMLYILANTLFLCTIGWFFSSLLAQYLVGDIKTLYLVKMTWFAIIFTQIASIPNICFRAERRAKLVVTLNLIKVTFGISISVILVLILKMGLYGAVLATLLSAIFSALLSIPFSLQYFRFQFNVSMWKRMISFGLPFLPHRLQTVGMVEFGKFIVRTMLGLEQAGLYNVAEKFNRLLNMIVDSIQTAWVPYKFAIYHNDKDPKSFYKAANTYYFTFVFFVWIFTALFAGEFILLLTPHQYHAARWIVPFLISIPVARGFFTMFATGVDIAKQTTKVMRASFTGLIIVVTTTPSLTEELGAAGAALGSVLGWIGMFLVIYYYSQKYYYIKYQWNLILTFVVTAISVVSIVLWVTDPLNTGARVGIKLSGMIVYCGVVLITLWNNHEGRDHLIEFKSVIRSRILSRFRKTSPSNL